MTAFTTCLNPATVTGLPLTDFLHLAAGAGFEAVEVSIQQVLQEGPGRVAELLEELGLNVAAASGILPAGPVLPHPLLVDRYAAALEGAADRLEAMHTIGCPTATIVLNPRSRHTLGHARATAAARIRGLARLCAEHEVSLAVEAVGVQQGLPADLDGPHEVARTLPQLRDLLAPISEDNVAVCVDAFHWAATGADPADLNGLNIGHVQIADAPASVLADQWSDAMRLFPGEGDAVPWTVLADALHAAGYRGAVSVELFNPDLRALPEKEIAARSLEGARSCWGGGQ